ncbi:MarR family winged helix-turn-helix transcriptional regulator [Euzebya sp.]|uniref:MarR family winged helix-turn-helix transcriptional regulator n=1 Tax=Euzebya sp. TaxID=1971409 RepID=UPI00351379EB
MSPSPEPARFTALARGAGRDRERSRAAVAVLRANATVSRALDRALAEAGLTLPQFNVLMELAVTPDGALALYELNDRLVTTPPNMSWLSGRMADAGLVTKQRSAADARVAVLALTEAGWAALERALPLVSDAERALLAAYEPAELAVMAELLSRLVGAPT